MEAVLLPLLLIAVFYFLLIRPQQRQRRQMMNLQQALTPGARVMTGSGLFGTVVSIDGDEVDLEVAPGMTNRYARRAIVNVVNPEVPDDASGLDDDTSGLDEPGPSESPDVPSEEHTNGDDAR